MPQRPIPRRPQPEGGGARGRGGEATPEPPDTGAGQKPAANGSTSPLPGAARERVPPATVDRATDPSAGARRDAETSIANTKQILERLITHLTQATGSDWGSFYVYDETRSRVEFSARSEPSGIVVLEHETAGLPPTQVPAEVHVLETKRPLHLTTPEDFRRYPPVNPALAPYAEQGRLVRLVLPLLWDDDVIGVAYLSRTHAPLPYSEDEVELAEYLAALASIAVVAHRQVRSERRERQLLERLLAVSRAMARLSDLDRIFALVVDAVRCVLGTTAATLYLYDESGEATTGFYGAGLTAYETEIAQRAAEYRPDDIPVERRVRTSLQPVLLHAAEFASQMLPLGDNCYLPTEREVASVLVIPLVDQGRMTGVCYTWSHDPAHQFDPQALETAVTLLQVAGGAVTRARLQERTERHLVEREALWEVARTVNSSETVEEALDRIVAVIRQLVPFDTAVVAEPDRCAPGWLVVRWVWGDAPEHRIGGRVPVDHSLVGHVFRTGEPLNVADTSRDPRTYRPDGQRFPIRSVSIHPLTYEGHVTGVLGIGRIDGPAFTPDEHHLVAVLAQEASTAVALVQARQAIERRERSNALLAHIGDALLRASDPTAMVDVVARSSAGVLGEVVCVALNPLLSSDAHLDAVYHVDPARQAQLRALLLHGGYSAVAAWLGQPGDPVVVRRADLPRLPDTVLSRLRLLMDAAGTRVVVAQAWNAGHRQGVVTAALAGDDPDRIAETVTLIRPVAQRLSAAVERWHETQTREALLRVSTALARPRDLPDLLQTVMQELNAVLPHDRFVLAEADEPAGLLRPLLQCEACRELLGDDWTVSFGEGILGTVAAAREAVLVEDARRDSRILHPAFRGDEETSSLMAAPLLAENRLLGVLLAGRTGPGQFTPLEFQTFQFFAGQVAVALWQAQQRERERALYRASVQVLAATVDAKDPYTHDHSQKVARYARLIAEAMGCAPDEVERIEQAALLHDIGKIAVPDSILRKPGRLTPAEWETMKTHATAGAEILAAHPALHPIVPLVRHHHERWDGRGYPDGLRGAEIPLGAAIIGLADAFDTMTSDRPYRRALSLVEALEELERCSGTQFHPDVVAAFRRAIEDSPELAGLIAASTLSRAPTAELMVLREFGERLANVADFATLAQVIDLTLSGSLGTSDLGVLLFDDATGELVLRYSRWYPHLNDRLRLPPGKGASWDVIGTGQPLVVRDPRSHPKLLKLGARPFSTAILAPIVADGRPIGTLAVSRIDPADPEKDERDARVLAAIGRHIGPLVQTLARTTLAN